MISHAADAFAAAQVLQQAVDKVGSLDQTKLADYLHGNPTTTILGPLSWDKTGAPQNNFLLAQWQSGKVQIVAPRTASTTTKSIAVKPDWK